VRSALCIRRRRRWRGSETCCAAARMCAARGWRRAIGCSSSCCDTAGSTGRVSTRGPSSIASGLTVSAWTIRSPKRQLEQTLIHLDGLDRQLALLDATLERLAREGCWAEQVQVLVRFGGIATLTALGLIAEVGDFHRFGHPRELASWLGITPTEYSSGAQQHRGHITRAGNEHARRLLIEAAWHYRHPPRRSTRRPEPDQRAWQAQVRLFHRWRHLTEHGKRSTVADVAIARELAGFIWAAMTNQPLREETAA
jgi:transposase